MNYYANHIRTNDFNYIAGVQNKVERYTFDHRNAAGEKMRDHVNAYQFLKLWHTTAEACSLIKGLESRAVPRDLAQSPSWALAALALASQITCKPIPNNNNTDNNCIII